MANNRELGELGQYIIVDTSTNKISVNANLSINTTSSIIANGSIGTNGQVLTSNGTTVYWANGGGGGGGGTLTTFSANVGNTTANSFTVTHNLDSFFLITTIRETSTGYIVYPDIQQTTSNDVVISFVDNPTANQYVVLVSKVA
jgi:hypothetical protein